MPHWLSLPHPLYWVLGLQWLFHLVQTIFTVTWFCLLSLDFVSFQPSFFHTCTRTDSGNCSGRSRYSLLACPFLQVTHWCGILWNVLSRIQIYTQVKQIRSICRKPITILLPFFLLVQSQHNFPKNNWFTNKVVHFVIFASCLWNEHSQT